MIVTLILFLVLVVFLAFFIGFNLSNVCTFWFFKTYENLPVAVLVLISFAAGIVLSILVYMIAKLKKSLTASASDSAKTSEEKRVLKEQKAAERNRKREEKQKAFEERRIAIQQKMEERKKRAVERSQKLMQKKANKNQNESSAGNINGTEGGAE